MNTLLSTVGSDLDGIGGFYLFKLFEEPDVVFEQQTNVVDLVHQPGHPVDSQSEREPGKLFGIDPDLLEHVRMNHAAAAKLDPTRAFAQTATFAVTAVTAEIDFG